MREALRTAWADAAWLFESTPGEEKPVAAASTAGPIPAAAVAPHRRLADDAWPEMTGLYRAHPGAAGSGHGGGPAPRLGR